MKRATTHRRPGRAAGTTLLTALVMLLVLTLLGSFGMRQARLEQRMAGNTMRQATALANAEYTLTVAEAELAALTASPFHPDRPGDHYYPQDTLDFDPGRAGIQQPTDPVWHFRSVHVALPDLDGDGSDSDADGIADDGTGQYVIQAAGSERTLREVAPREDGPAVLAGSALQAFRVTARGHGNGGTQRTVQSVYVRAALDTTPGEPAAAHPRAGRHSWIDLRE